MCEWCKERKGEGTGEWRHKISVNSGSPVDAFFEITRPFSFFFLVVQRPEQKGFRHHVFTYAPLHHPDKMDVVFSIIIVLLTGH